MTAGYKRNQRRGWIALLSFAIALTAGFFNEQGHWFKLMAFVVGILSAAVASFSELRVTIDNESVQWSLGGSWPRGSIPLIRIERVAQIELGLLQGWHAHWTIWHGWNWRIWRFRAVQITMRDGSRVILGTGAPHALFNAIIEQQRLPA